MGEVTYTWRFLRDNADQSNYAESRNEEKEMQMNGK